MGMQKLYKEGELKMDENMIKDGKRTDNDIDSIEYGTPSKGGFKMYFNSRIDTQKDLEIRVTGIINLISFSKSKMPI